MRMSDQHKISEYIDNLALKQTFCRGFRPDDVYEAICELTSMYNEILSESYEENEKMKEQNERLTEQIEQQGRMFHQVQDQEQSKIIEMQYDDYFKQRNQILKDIAEIYEFSGKKNTFSHAEMLEEVETEVIQAETSKSEEYVEVPETEQNNEIVNETETPVVKQEEAETKTETKAEEEKSARRSDRSLQRLKRGELLELLLEQSKENEELRQQVESLTQNITQLEEKLADRTIEVEKAGTIAEAAFKLNGVYAAAEAAAQQYLDNLKLLYKREEKNCVQKEAETEAYVKKMLAEAEFNCEEKCRQTESKCVAMELETEERCHAMKEDMEKQCTVLEEDSRIKCREMEETARIRCEEKERETIEKCKTLEFEAEMEVEKNGQNFLPDWKHFIKHMKGYVNYL